jgi:hypothetical protein
MFVYHIENMSANVYIDGFNLYYGSLKDTSFKWLDVSKLVTSLFPNLKINKIRYFTARVKPLPHNLNAPNRQNAYLRALGTLPNLTIHEGRYALREVRLPQFPLAYINGDRTRAPQNVQVQKSEEKRSDVNLATLLLSDCFQNDFDEAIVITNDSDLTLPIDMVIKICHKSVHVVNPQLRSKLSMELRQVATSIMFEINTRHLVNSQFPPTMTDKNGTFTKPATW